MRFWHRSERVNGEFTDWNSLRKLKNNGRLLSVLKSEAASYIPDDLDIMMQRSDDKIRDLPARYRAELKKFTRIQVLKEYNRLSTAVLDPVHRKEKKLSKNWQEFVECVAGGTIRKPPSPPSEVSDSGICHLHRGKTSAYSGFALSWRAYGRNI